MFRFFLTIFLVLAAFLVGFYLGNEPVSHLTQTVNGLTIELDGMRERMASPAAEAAPAEGAAKTADELHVINEGIAAFRQELAEQKAMLEKNASASAQPELAPTATELIKARSDLEACEADKLDLKARMSGAAAVPAAPAPVPAQPPVPSFQYKPYDPSRR